MGSSAGETRDQQKPRNVYLTSTDLSWKARAHTKPSVVPRQVNEIGRRKELGCSALPRSPNSPSDSRFTVINVCKFTAIEKCFQSGQQSTTNVPEYGTSVVG
jgi:hypothetical protein